MFKESSSWLIDNEDRTSIMECCRPELNSPWDDGYTKPTKEQERKEKILDGMQRHKQYFFLKLVLNLKNNLYRV